MSDVLSRLTAALADRYRIERELGAGGMATVYLAHDVRHERDVAVKVLHPDLGAVLGDERFLSEIKTTARLQHPHILPLLDSGMADGLLFYVMPYVTGETLRARLERERQLPIEDALRTAREVADALGAAHALGIVHRDIKPENILLQRGHALVADFGIALAVQQAGGARMTQTGLSLGTPQYMSPEQAMGEKLVDARADIYALGAVTYEMLTGDPPFTGSSVQAIVAKVLTEKPTAPRAVRDTVTIGVEQAVLQALAKLPADRPATAEAFVGMLDAHGAAAATTVEGATKPGNRGSRALLVAGAGNVALAVLCAFAWLRPPPEPPVSRQQVVLWRHSLPNMYAAGATFAAARAAIAPDGSSIVFSDSVDGGWALMRKRRESEVATQLDGTTGAVSPFFSPDGRWIGFTTIDHQLRKIPVDGGTPVTIADDVGNEVKVAAWLEDGSIVYARGPASAVQIPSAGGTPRRLRFPGTSNTPTFFLSLSSLPGDRGFVGGTCRGNCVYASDVFVYDAKADSARILVPGATAAWYEASGHLLFTGRDGGLFAAPFDVDRLELQGEPVPVIDGVAPGSVALSREGQLLYALGEPTASEGTLVWVDRRGTETPFDSSWRGRFEYPALSPDGRSLAVSVNDRTTDLWIQGSDGDRRRVLSGGAVNWRPVWSADGTSLLFVSVNDLGEAAERAELMRVGADGSAPAELFYRHGRSVWEGDWTADQQTLVFRCDDCEATAGSSIYYRHMTGDTATRRFSADDALDLQLALSPDGRFLAYTSSILGVPQIIVATFPDGRTRRMVSRVGGMEPRFARSGRELFFENAGRLWSVALGDDDTVAASEPQPLFPLMGYRRARNRQQYDVSPDGQRFLMIKEPPAPPVPLLVYVEHWMPELRAKVRP